jgi:predicted oxidoreductase
LPYEGGPSSPPENLYKTVQDARIRWQQAPELPRGVQQDLAVRYHQTLGRLVSAWPSAFTGTDLDPDMTRKRMEKLVTRVEELAPEKARAQAALSPAELLAQQWRDRLAANTMTGGKSADTEDARWRAAEQEVRNAQAQWARFGPVPAETAALLNERFQRACRRFYDSKPRVVRV